MLKSEKIIKKTFEDGNIRDAMVFLITCVNNAFPEFNFRGIEIVRLVTGKRIIEGKSWNHEFIIRLSELNGAPAWEVNCHRSSNGVSADKTVFLDATTLEQI
jgi:hypothetical protein